MTHPHKDKSTAEVLCEFHKQLITGGIPDEVVDQIVLRYAESDALNMGLSITDSLIAPPDAGRVADIRISGGSVRLFSDPAKVAEAADKVVNRRG